MSAAVKEQTRRQGGREGVHTLCFLMSWEASLPLSTQSALTMVLAYLSDVRPGQAGLSCFLSSHQGTNFDLQGSFVFKSNKGSTSRRWDNAAVTGEKKVYKASNFQLNTINLDIRGRSDYVWISGDNSDNSLSGQTVRQSDSRADLEISWSVNC